MNEIYIKFIYNLECLPGYFGVDCRESCSGHCINDESCNHISGHCSSGCQDGYFGEMCNKCKLWILHHLGYISRSMVVGFYKINKNSNNDHNNYINNNYYYLYTITVTLTVLKYILATYECLDQLFQSSSS